MNRAETPRKPRPPIRLILAAMLLIAMATPLVGLFFLRVIENQLVRRTEAELIGQTAALAAVFADGIVGAKIDPAWFGREAQGEFHRDLRDRWAPLTPGLDLARDPVLPPRPEAKPALSPAQAEYVEVARALRPVVRATTRRTLAGVQLLDAQGRVLIGREAEMSLAHVEEIAEALDGRFAAQLRTRLRERPPPLIYSLTKGASLRVFVAFPVVVEGRVAGVVYASRSPQHVLQMAAAERDKLMLAGLAMLLLLAVMGFIAARAITGPIRALTERTRAIAAGDPDALRPLERHGTAEVADLSEIFLRTARRLQDRTDDMANFAAHVSHELKSPLTAIQGAAELIRDAEADMSPEERRAFLDNIIKDAGRMALLVRRLLELARADARSDEPMGASVASIADRLAGRAPLPVEIDDPAAVPLAISAEKLEIALSTMADNAALHGAERLSVRVRAAGRMAEIEVADDGEGVSPANRDKIFEPFFTTRRHSGGTGMGLPIVKAMLEARGGSIALTTGSGGARFRLTLPLA